MATIIAPVCPYCGGVSVLMQSARVYRGGNRGTNYGPVWLCAPCNAYVGCHPGTKQPLGRLANSRLRQLRQRTHAAFDPFWQNALKRLQARLGADLPRDAKSHARNACYDQLAAALGIKVTACHIAMFDEAQCLAAIDICQAWSRSKESA